MQMYLWFPEWFNYRPNVEEVKGRLLVLTAKVILQGSGCICPENQLMATFLERCNLNDLIRILGSFAVIVDWWHFLTKCFFFFLLDILTSPLLTLAFLLVTMSLLFSFSCFCFCLSVMSEESVLISLYVMLRKLHVIS